MPDALVAGTAMRIMTGAPMPEGADTVVRQEDTSRDGAAVIIEVATPLATSVRPRGADMRAGDTRDPAGAAADQHRHRCRRRARSRPSSRGHATARRPARHRATSWYRPVPPPGPAQLVDSNSPMLTAAVREAGGDADLPRHRTRFEGVGASTAGGGVLIGPRGQQRRASASATTTGSARLRPSWEPSRPGAWPCVPASRCSSGRSATPSSSACPAIRSAAR